MPDKKHAMRAYRPFWSLVRLLLNVNFSLSALRHRYFVEKKRRWELLAAPAIVLSFAPLMAIFLVMFDKMYGALETLHQEASILTIGILAAQLTALIFGIFYIISAFYFSHDLAQLVPLPLRPSQVAGAKFIVVAVNEYLTMALMFVPPAAIYAWHAGLQASAWTVLSSIVVFALLPVIPLVLASILAVVIMRVTNVRRHRDLLRIVGAVFGMAMAVAWQFFFSRTAQSGGIEDLAALVASQNGFIKLVGENFPPSIWATLAIVRPWSLEALAGFAYFAAVSAVALWLLWLATEKWFYTGLLSGGEAAARKKALGAAELRRRAGTTLPPALAILRREWKVFMRTPVYVLNGLVGVLFAPVILFVMLVANGQLREVQGFLQDPAVQGWIALVVAGFVMVLTAMNTVAATAVSREGRYFWLSQLIPVAPGEQLQGKLLHAGVLAAIAAVVTFIFGLALGIGSWSTLLIGAAIGLIGSWPVVEAGLAIDLLRPNLKWTDPQQAMKGNINGLFGMLAGVVIGGAGALLIWALARLGVSEWSITGGVAVLYLAIGVGFYRALRALAERRWREIEL